MENFDERIDKTTGNPVDIDMLVFHCSAYPTPQLIQVFKDLGVSAHYIIDTDGVMTQLVDESQRAWHAGAGSWQEKGDVNSRSIGIELINASLGHSIPYTESQIETLIKLSKKIMKRYAILPHNIIAHSDFAPTRKYDPGRLFPWAQLAKEGIGLWPEKKTPQTAETDVMKLLYQIGYPLENPKASLRSFVRHFMPEMIPDQENPTMNQYDFLLEYEKNLPQVLEKESFPNDKILTKLQQVAFLYMQCDRKREKYE